MQNLENLTIGTRLERVLAANRQASRKNLVTFITAGDPHLQACEQLMHTLVASGVDVIELGIPFSDPMADGPVIQRASERAVAQGVGLRDVLALVARFRLTHEQTPIVLMGYANPIECMGQEAFIHEAVAAGVDGVLVVDYPPEESHEFALRARAAGLNQIYLVAPTTTPERMQATADVASGFIYYVSLKGVTGSGSLDVVEVAQKVSALRHYTDLPIHVGFGISDAQSAQTVAQTADGVVIGSKLITIIESEVSLGRDPNPAVQAWLSEIRLALDAI